MSLLTLQMPALPDPVKVVLQPATTALLVFDMPGNPVFIGIIGGPLWNSNPFAVIRNDPLVKSTGAVGGFGDDDRHRV